MKEEGRRKKEEGRRKKEGGLRACVCETSGNYVPP